MESLSNLIEKNIKTQDKELRMQRIGSDAKSDTEEMEEEQKEMKQKNLRLNHLIYHTPTIQS